MLIASSITLLFMFCIIQTVSKKAILGAVLLLLLWFFLCFQATFLKMNWFIRLFLLVVLFLGAYYAYDWYTINYEQNYEYLSNRLNP